MSLHIYQAPAQPATRWKDVITVGGRTRTVWTRWPAHRRLWTFCCRRKRLAKYCMVRVYYDVIHIFCAPGKGCKSP